MNRAIRSMVIPTVAVVLMGRVCEWGKDRSPSLSVKISTVGQSDSGSGCDRE